MNTISVFNTEKYRAFYEAITSEDNLAARLAAMPKKYGVQVEDIEALVEECMNAVSEYEYARNLAHDGEILSALEDILNNCGSTIYERMHILHQINFGLSHNAKETVEISRDCSKISERFNDYMAEDAESPASEDELKKNILDRMSDICLSKKELSVFITQIALKGDMLDITTDLSMSSYEIKCVAAMDEYLRGNYESMALAACEVCKEKDLQTLSYSFVNGEISESNAMKYLDGIIAACVYATVVLIVSGIASEMPVLIFAGAVAFIAGLMLLIKCDQIADSVGMFVAKQQYEKAVAEAEAVQEYEDFINDFASNFEDCETSEEEYTLLEPFSV